MPSTRVRVRVPLCGSTISQTPTITVSAAQISRTTSEPTEWAENALLYESPTGTPFVSVIHPGGHKFYRESVPLMVRFFKEHARRPAAASVERGASAP